MKEIFELIPTEIIGAAISAVVSAVVSWIISHKTCEYEIKKMQLTWAHEAETAFNANFEAMSCSVTQFVKLGSDTTWREALAMVAKVRASSPDELTHSLDGLYNVVSRRHMKGAEVALTKTIEAKRIYDSSRKSHTKTAD